jgi:hypothetical protein
MPAKKAILTNLSLREGKVLGVLGTFKFELILLDNFEKCILLVR